MKRKSGDGIKRSKKVKAKQREDPLRFGENYDPSTFHVHIYEDERTDVTTDGRLLASQNDASEFMQWLIAPCPLTRFTNQIFDRHPLYVSRSLLPKYFDGWHSSVDVKNLLQQQLKYTTNVDVRKYVDGKVHYMNMNDEVKSDSAAATKKNTSNEVADPEVVWRRFSKEGCTIRILHPQRWCDSLHAMMAACERFWGCATGCNVYLTPPNTQGFPLHFDEIDAFILQLEGSKTWRVYAPKDAEDLLPRAPPLTHFEQGLHGEPILEVTLTPGDLLYLPRGAPHQALANEDGHSLHITLSTNQYNTWADFLEIAIPQALEIASKETPALRQTLPLGFLKYMGVVHQEDEDEGDEGDAQQPSSAHHAQRMAFEALAMGMMQFVTSLLPLDSAADQLGKRLTQQRLPPPPVFDGNKFVPSSSAAASSSSSSSSVSSASSASKKIKTAKKPSSLDRRVRLAYPECARLSVEEDTAVVSHHLNNSRLLHMEGEAAQVSESHQLLFELDSAPAIEVLLTSDSSGVLISELPVLGGDFSVVNDTVKRLFEAGIIEYC